MTTTETKKTVKMVKRYFVCVGSFARAHTRRFYDYRTAQKLAKRARRLGLDAYVSSPMLVRA